MRILELTEETRKNLQEDLLKRSPNSYTEYEARVNEIIGQVRERRDEAVFSYTKQFDGAELGPETVRVSREEVEAAYQNTEPGLIEVMKKSLDNIRAYHEKQKQYSWFDSRPDGVLLGQKVTALEKVGVYVPGGQGILPFVGPDERYPGKGGRGAKNCHGYALQPGGERQSCHIGGGRPGRGR